MISNLFPSPCGHPPYWCPADSIFPHWGRHRSRWDFFRLARKTYAALFVARVCARIGRCSANDRIRQEGIGEIALTTSESRSRGLVHSADQVPAGVGHTPIYRGAEARRCTVPHTESSTTQITYGGISRNGWPKRLGAETPSLRRRYFQIQSRLSASECQFDKRLWFYPKCSHFFGFSLCTHHQTVILKRDDIRVHGHSSTIRE